MGWLGQLNHLDSSTTPWIPIIAFPDVKAVLQYSPCSMHFLVSLSLIFLLSRLAHEILPLWHNSRDNKRCTLVPFAQSVSRYFWESTSSRDLLSRRDKFAQNRSFCQHSLKNPKASPNSRFVFKYGIKKRLSHFYDALSLSRMHSY